MTFPRRSTRPCCARNSRRWGGERVQYSVYLFEGEPHEIDRIIRYMRRVAQLVPDGDIRLIPMERAVWEQQIVLKGDYVIRKQCSFPEYVVFW